MTLDVHLFPCRSDNYGFLIRDAATGVVAAVDTPDADRILHALQGLGWGRLDLILNTHWHPDHTEGNARLKAETGCEIVGPEEVARVAPLDRAVGDGDIVQVGETRFQVTATPGHTLGHIVYRSAADDLAFVGDTLFALGCGRLFEGTAEQMFDSLQRLKAWPDRTVRGAPMNIRPRTPASPSAWTTGPRPAPTPRRSSRRANGANPPCRRGWT